MKRKALLIGNSGNKNIPDEYLAGVAIDIENYKKFLLSKYGGLWYEEEIITSLDETKEQIQKKILRLKEDNNNFIFILFSGHGSFSELKDCRKLYIYNDFIYENNLTYLAPKQITILDTCADIETNSLLLGMEALNESYIFNEKLTNLDYRKKYEEAIIASPEQQVILYSSSKGESSGDSTESGGYFSYNLLQVALNNKKPILSSKEALNYAEKIVQDKTKLKQNPQGEFIKTSNILPFSLGEIKWL